MLSLEGSNLGPTRGLLLFQTQPRSLAAVLRQVPSFVRVLTCSVRLVGSQLCFVVKMIVTQAHYSWNPRSTAKENYKEKKQTKIKPERNKMG